MHHVSKGTTAMRYKIQDVTKLYFHMYGIFDIVTDQKERHSSNSHAISPLSPSPPLYSLSTSGSTTPRDRSLASSSAV